MSFYNSRQSKVFAQRFTLVKSDNEVAHNIDFSCAHPINQDNKSVFYDKKQNEMAKRFVLVKKTN